MRATSESAEWIFLATNLGLEMLSAACDQASSPRRPHFALSGMLLAIAAMLLSIGELIYRGKKERVVFRSWGMLGWFYHPSPRLYKPFGTLPDIFGLVAGISQCICSMVQYVYCLRHADNPFKVSLLPAIFLVCLGSSKLINSRIDPNTTDNEDSRANIPSLDDQEVEGNIEQQWLKQEQEQEEEEEEEEEQQQEEQQEEEQVEEQVQWMKRLLRPKLQLLLRPKLQQRSKLEEQEQEQELELWQQLYEQQLRQQRSA
ncbi:hypothetical protein CerSpe_175760 [Prunus speciosa]